MDKFTFRIDLGIVRVLASAFSLLFLTNCAEMVMVPNPNQTAGLHRSGVSSSGYFPTSYPASGQSASSQGSGYFPTSYPTTGQSVSSQGGGYFPTSYPTTGHPSTSHGGGLTYYPQNTGSNHGGSNAGHSGSQDIQFFPSGPTSNYNAGGHTSGSTYPYFSASVPAHSGQASSSAANSSNQGYYPTTVKDHPQVLAQQPAVATAANELTKGYTQERQRNIGWFGKTITDGMEPVREGLVAAEGAKGLLRATTPPAVKAAEPGRLVDAFKKLFKPTVTQANDPKSQTSTSKR